MYRTLAALLLLAAFAHAQVMEMVPEARTLPAPDWVKPGVRLTWYMASASREGKSVRFAPHFGSNAKTEDGKKVKLSKDGSASGHGYSEIVIVAVEPKRIVWEMRHYILAGGAPRGPATLVGVAGGICDTPGTLDGYWMNPVALRNLLAKPAGSHGFIVGALKENVNGEERDAIQVAMRDEKSHFRWVYDLNSGVLLSQGHSQTGTKGIGGTGVDGTDYSGKTWGATMTRFREFSQLKLPWLGAPPPDWARTIKAIDFEGGYRMIIAGAPAVAPLTMSQRFATRQVGGNWVLYERTMVNGPRGMLDRGGAVGGMPVAPVKGPFVAGEGCPGGLWIPPAVVRKLTKGQEICRSPVTEFTATVFYVGPNGGRDVCVIRWENRLQTIDLVYDRVSGGLLRIADHNRVLSTQTWYDFVGSR